MKRCSSKAVDATEPVVEPLESRVLYSADILFGDLTAVDSDLPQSPSDLAAIGVLQGKASDSIVIDITAPAAPVQAMPVKEYINAVQTDDRQVEVPVEPPADSLHKQEPAAVVVSEPPSSDDPQFYPAYFVTADHVDGAAHQLSAAAAQTGEVAQSSDPAQIMHATPLAQADLSALNPDLRLEVVFVDPAVTDKQVLIDTLSGSEHHAGQLLVVELAANEDGVKQIAGLLSQLSGVDAIHLLSHGDNQGLDLGSARLDITSSAQYLIELDAWAASMDAGADVLVYGCNLASSAEGRQLLQFIGSFCDCDVAASDDVTGHVLLGGDWSLEYTQGDIDTDVVLSQAAQDAWEGTLTPQDVYVVPGVTDARIIGYYDFETASQLGRDHAGDDANITFFGGATQTASQGSGQALAISGGQYGDITGITTGGAMTIAGMVRFDATGGWERIVDFGQATSGGIGNIYVSRDSNTADLVFTIEQNGSYVYRASATGAITNGSWLSFAATVDESGLMTLYLNGAAVDTVAGAVPAVGVRDNHYIGRSNWAGDASFNGAIDHLLVANGVMSAAEVQALHGQTGISVSEGAANGTVIGTALAPNSQSGIGHTYLLTGDAGGRFVIDSVNGEISVADGGRINFEADSSHTITVQVIDSLSNVYTESLSVAVVNVNDLSVLVPQGLSVVENSDLTFTSVSIIDEIQPAGATFEVSLFVNDGVLDLSSLSGITVEAGADGSGSMTIRGTEANINNALLNMRFTPDSGFSGSVELTMTAAHTPAVADLVGRYTFTGGDATDYSVGSPQHGILTGGATTTIDPVRGEVLSVDGNQQYTEVPATAAQPTFWQPADVTLSAWVNLDAGSADGDIINIGDIIGVRADYVPLNGVVFFHHDGSDWVELASSVNIAGTGWRHIAATFDSVGAVAVIYIDGLQVATTTPVSPLDYGMSTGVTRIGAHAGASTAFDFNGQLDDVLVYQRALSAAEIAGLANDRLFAEKSALITVTPDLNEVPVFSDLDGNRAYQEGDHAVQLDGDVEITDPDLTAIDNFAGSTLTLQRNGGADSNDVYSASGLTAAFTEGSSLMYGGVVVGVVNTNSGGTLQLIFGSNATNNVVDGVMQSIHYRFIGEVSPGNVQIDWVFNDGNTGAQGSGAALVATGDTKFSITVINDAPVNFVPGTQTVDHEVRTAIGGFSILDVDAATANLTTRLLVSNGVLDVTLAGLASISAGANNSGDLTILGSLVDINNTLMSLAYTGDTNAFGSAADTLVVTTDDGGNAGTGGSRQDTDSVQIDINPPNDAPVITSPANAVVSEEVQTLISGVSIADSDAGSGNLTIRLQVSSGEVNVNLAGSVAITAGANSSYDLTIRGALADINSTLATLAYTGNTDSNGIAADTLTVTADDEGNTGVGGAQQDSASVQIDITAVNDAPVVTAPATQNVSEETHTSISGVSVADNDAGTGALATRLQVGSGVVDVTLSGAVVVTAGVNGSDDVTISGPVSDMNLTLASLRYTGNSDVTGVAADTLLVTVDDEGNTGSGGSLQDSQSVQINIAAVNDAPVVVAPATQKVDEETQSPINGISVTDADIGESVLTTRLQVSSGVVNVTLSGTAVISSGSNGSNDLTIQGSLADTNSALASIGYTANADVTGVAADTLIVTTDDGGNTGTGGALQDSESVQIDITAVNDAPVITVPATQTVDEETPTSINGVSIADVDVGAGLLTTRLQVGSGVLNVILSGAATISSGSNGSNDLTVQGSLADTNSTLASISYAANTDVTGISADALIVSTDDGGSTGTGGALQDSASIQIGIGAVNDAPVIAVPATQTVSEEIPALISGVSIADVDVGAGILTTRLQVGNGVVNVTLSGASSISAGSNGSSDLTIQGSLADTNSTLASISYTANADVTGLAADTLLVTTDDGGSTGAGGVLQDSASVQIVITAVNDAPVITVPATQMANEEIQTPINGVSIADVDVGAGVITARLQVGSGVLNLNLTGSAVFSAGVNHSNDLTIQGSLSDVNSSLSSLAYTGNADVTGLAADRLLVYTDDGGNTGIGGALQDAQSVQINIAGINDAPVFGVPGVQTVNEEIPTAIYGVSVADVDAGTGSLTTRLQVANGVVSVTLSGGVVISSGANASNDLTISGSQANINSTLATLRYTGNVDVTGTVADTLILTADDFGNTGASGALQAGASVPINITAINDAPGITVPATQLLTEDTPTAIGGVSVDDVDVGAGSLATRLQVANGVLDVTLTGLATISAGANNSADVTVLGPLVDVNSTLASLIYTSKTDVNGIAADTLMVLVDDGGHTGSGGALQDNASVQLDIVAINDAPVLSVPGVQAIDEEVQTAIGGISIADVDVSGNDLAIRIQVASGVLNVVLAGGATISAGTNGGDDLTVRGSLNDVNSTLATLAYTGDVNVTGIAADAVTLTVNDLGNTGTGGALTDIRSIQIDITAVNDAPVITVPGTVLIAEEEQGAISGISISDVDSGAADLTARLQVSNGVLNVVPAGAATISSGANNSADMTVQGVLADVNATLATLRYTGNTDANGVAADSLLITSSDLGNSGLGGALLDSKTVQINLSAVNDAPLIALPVSVSVAEEISTQVSGISISDVDVGAGNLTVRLQVNTGVLNVVLSGVSIAAGANNSADVTIMGSLANINATLGLLSYTGNMDVVGVAADTLLVTVNDTGNTGAGGMLQTSRAVPIDIVEVNDAPVVTVPSSLQVDEEIRTTVAGVSIVDVDAGSANLTTSLSVANGILHVALAGNAVVTAGALQSGDLAIEGSVADTNATLASLSYTGNTDLTGVASDTLVVTTNDSGDTGSGGALSATGTIQIDILPVNDAPVVSGIESQALQFTENDVATPVSSLISIVDVDNIDLNSATVQLDGNYQADQDVLLFAGYGNITSSWDSNNGVLQLNGDDTVANYQAALRSISYQNLSDDPATVPRTVSFTVFDGQGSSSAVGRQVEVVEVNDAPSGSDTRVSTPEDFSYFFSVADFGFNDTLDANAFTGITVVVLPTEGDVYVSQRHVSVGDFVTVDEINAGQLRYSPLPDANGGYEGLGFIVHDDGGVDFGGIDQDPQVRFVSFDIPGVNDPPQLLINEIAFDEESDNQFDTSILNATDADDNADALIFSLSTLPANGTLTLNGDVLQAGDSFSLQQLIDNSLRYQHNGSETEADFFDLSLRDASEVVSGRVSFVINEVIDAAPQLEPDSFMLKFGEQFNSQDSDLLDSGFASVLDNDPAVFENYQITLEADAKRGRLELNADGTFSYEHNRSSVLNDEFSYRVTNEDGVFATTTVQISLEPPQGAANELRQQPVENEPVKKETDRPTSKASTLAQSAAAAPLTEDVFEPVPETVVSTPATIYQSGNVAAYKYLSLVAHNTVNQKSPDNDSFALASLSSVSIDLVFDLFAHEQSDVLSNKKFAQELDDLSGLFDDWGSNEETRRDVFSDGTLAVSIATTTGIVASLLRGGVLLGGALSAAPLWSSIDPVRVFKSKDDVDEADVQDSKIESVFD